MRATERMRLVMRGERGSGPSQDPVRGPKVLLEETGSVGEKRAK